MRTLIVLLICAAFVCIAVMEAKASAKPRAAVIRDAAVGLFFGLVCCWILVYWIGIFDGWKYSLRS